MSALGEIGFTVWLITAIMLLCVPEFRSGLVLMWKYRKIVLAELKKQLADKQKAVTP